MNLSASIQLQFTWIPPDQKSLRAAMRLWRVLSVSSS